jgi:tetratricopeptide (TPR) repeat protein
VNEIPQLMPTETRTALQNCFAQIRLARATELAQSGRLLEAETLLAQNSELPRNASELDLLARLAARQGRFDEARRRWNAAIQIEPGNEIYRLCIEQLTPTRRIVRLIANSQDTLLNVLVWATVAFAVAALIYVFRG